MNSYQLQHDRMEKDGGFGHTYAVSNVRKETARSTLYFMD